MAYTKTQWQDLPNETTPINASNLNKIENELEALDTGKADKTVATTSTNGLMSANDKSKLDNLTDIQTGACSYNTNVFNTPRSNSYEKIGNMVHVNFNAKFKNATTWQDTLFYLPYRTAYSFEHFVPIRNSI